MSESKLQAKILTALTKAGYVNTKVVVANTAGVLDIIACTPEGKYLEIEVKYGKNKMTALQEHRQEHVKKCHGISFTVWTFEEFIIYMSEYGLSLKEVPSLYKPRKKPLL